MKSLADLLKRNFVTVAVVTVALLFPLAKAIALSPGVSVSKANSYVVLAPQNGVSVSKSNTYVVLSTPNGVSVSKSNTYVVLAPPGGVSVSKSNTYAILGPPPGVSVSKMTIYVVLQAPTAQPNVSIMTQNTVHFLPGLILASSAEDGWLTQSVNYVRTNDTPPVPWR